MSFDSPLFFALFVAVFLLIRAFPSLTGAILLTASLFFYSFAGTLDMCLAMIVVLFNYLVSFKVARNRRWLTAAVAGNLVVLVFFKYRHFLSPQLAAKAIDFFQGDILIPLGISFYTFQAIAYQVDLACGRTPHIRSFWHFALFKTFFAQLVAGPIVRANQLVSQVGKAFEGRIGGRRIWGLGLGLFLLGLIKKIVLADSLAPHVDAIFAGGPADTFTAWVGAILFTFQIYFDFSGYSDIAVGVGYLLGFRLPMNFRQPYLASNPQEFWQRWHITLSTWIRDYIYIPLGGSQKGGVDRQILVLLVTMGLAGLWHGANWTFVIWGLLWGLYVGLWRVARPALDGLGWWKWPIHIVIVILLWVFFRARSVTEGFSYVGVMFGASNSGDYVIADGTMQAILIGVGVVLLIWSQLAESWIMDFRRIVRLRRWDHPLAWGMLCGLIIWLLMNPKSSDNPFIYFRF